MATAIEEIGVDVQPGDIVILRDWNGNKVTGKATRISHSKVYGPVVEFWADQTPEGMWGFHRALPLSHVIEVKA